jgi:hypothetical protein
MPIMRRINQTYKDTKILSVVCDNASSNDLMIDSLADLIDVFPGATNRTRCFAHVINLVAKTITRQFDVPGKKNNNTLTTAQEELALLADGIDCEEIISQAEKDNEDGVEDDNDDGWVDEREGLSQDDVQNLDESILPVRRVLVKVSSHYQ